MATTRAAIARQNMKKPQAPAVAPAAPPMAAPQPPNLVALDPTNPPVGATQFTGYGQQQPPAVQQRGFNVVQDAAEGLERERRQAQLEEDVANEATWTEPDVDLSADIDPVGRRVVRPERKRREFAIEGSGGNANRDLDLPDVEVGDVGYGALGAMGSYGVGAPKLKPEAFKLEQNVRDAYGSAKTSAEGVLEATRQFQGSQERADILAEETARKADYVAAEQSRGRRLESLGRERENLAREAKGLSDFRVDPSRIFGEDKGARFGTTLLLGVSNVLSNIGESLQGKQASNAIVAQVRDAVERDLALQENDYRRQLQGLDARRTALGDLVKQVGDERVAAESIAKAQVEYSIARLKDAARGMEDAQARDVIQQAVSKLQLGLGEAEQKVADASVQTRNQFALAQASLNMDAAKTNASLAQARETERRKEIAAAGTMTEPEVKLVTEILGKAGDARIGERADVVRRMREKFLNNPGAIAALRGFKAKFRERVARDADSGTIMNWIAANLSQQMTPEERDLYDIYRRVRALKESGQGGKAITGIEDFLFRPDEVVDQASAMKVVEDEERDLLLQRKSFNDRGRALGGAARKQLRDALVGIVPNFGPKAPEVPEQPGPTR
jgi:hypothetical protein